jgi:release factor glutamine methyltransferase
MQLRQWLKAWEEELKRAGVDSPRLSAQLLASCVLGVGRVEMLLDAGQELEEGKREAIAALIARRRAGEPVAYILGEKEFYGLSFAVGPGVLVPRPETELMVDMVCGESGKEDEDFWIADFGSGSGALAVALAHEIPRANVVAVELSGEAAPYIRMNAARNGVADRVLVVRGDFCSPLLRAGAFQAVVANPPYIGVQEYSEISPEVREFEPKTALTPGCTGLELFAGMAAQAKRILRPRGRFFMEMGCRQGKDGLREINRKARWAEAGVVQDLAGLDRIIRAVS